MMSVGTPGLRQFSGYVNDEWLPQLQGPRGRQVYREMMDTDPVIGGFMFATEMLIRRVPWRVEASGDMAEALEDQVFIEQALHDMDTSFEDTLSEIMSFLGFGWEVSEVNLKRRMGPLTDDPLAHSRFDDGKIGWRNWSGRAQETLLHWNFDDEGNATDMVQLAPPDYRIRTIPLSKCLHFRTTVRKSNPEGRSILRNSYDSYYRKKYIQNSEGIGVERDLAGLPIAKVPPELLATNPTAANAAMRDNILRIVTSIRRDEQEGLLWPWELDAKGNPKYVLELLTTGGARQFDTDKIVARYDQRIAMPMLADFLLLGHEAVGSKALSGDKTEMFATAISAWLDMIAETINRVIPKLLALNGRDITQPPVLVHGDINATDLDLLSNYVLRLSQAGMPLFPDAELEDYLRRQADLPELSLDAISKEMNEGAGGRARASAHARVKGQHGGITVHTNLDGATIGDVLRLPPQ
jgi:hypothetical protein